MTARGYAHNEGIDGLDIARGYITGHVIINKFGRNREVTILEDVWDGGGIWAAPTASRIHAIVSTSTEDDAVGGDGARLLQIYGLVDWDTKEVSETVAMDGQVAVNTINSYVIIHRMEVVSDGTGGAFPNLGTITATAAVDGTVTAHIVIAEGQTQMAIYGIPSVQDLFLYGWYAGMNKAGGATAQADIAIRWNSDPANMPDHGVIKGTMGLISVGSSHFQHFNMLPAKFDGPGILLIDVLPSASVDISAGFDGVIIENV